MRKSFFCAALFFVISYANGQDYKSAYNDRATEFLKSFFADSAKPIVVATKLDDYTLMELKDALSVDSFFKRSTHDNWRTVILDTFVFSQDERGVLDSSFDAMQNFAWDGSLLPGASIISQQVVDSLKAMGAAVRSYMVTHYNTPIFYWLSKPVLLRNNTICIFYSEQYTGGPSRGVAAIWERTKSGWGRRMAIKQPD